MTDMQRSAGTHQNRLATQTSPYLRQHAGNPVDWHPWGPEALALARQSGKPILLSIGYSACHWCHVMAHESFEDADTAELMNALYVNIKVDREERPDLDKIYQVAHQLLAQRGGGWPLTMFLTHDDQHPFFGGTYFPKEARYGMPPFREVLTRAAEYYREHREELHAQSAALLRVYDELNPPPAAAGTPLHDAPLRAARARTGASFDREFGGFGGAPKFPHPATLERLLRDWHSTRDASQPDLEALYMATLTLKRMAEGGLYDQAGGGFSRYSVDRYWMIPHFEKMLYDNGALLAVYAQAALATADQFYARVAGDTAAWMLREMRSPEGGFYSSLDADSEGHEGRFYVWDRAEVQQTLTAEEYAVFAPRFGLDREPNFEGRWHLHVYQSIEQVAGERSIEATARLIDSARQKLLAIRERRVRPGRDEKILTSWNAIAIRGLAVAARALERADLARAAGQALDFIRSRLVRDGRLLATYKDGHAHLNAYLDDYVLLADAILELLQLRWRAEDLGFLRMLLDGVLDHFADEAGGFFFTSDDHEALMSRMKSFSDDATPSGNGVAARVLQRAGYLLGETRYLEAAEGALRAAWQGMESQPQAHMTMLTALEEFLHAPELLVLRGAAVEIERWGREIGRLYAPRRLVFAVPSDAPALPAAIAAKADRGRAVAYVCRGPVCSEPIESLAALVNHLRLGLSAT